MIALISDAGKENTETAATPVAGQENKDDNCYSCSLPRVYRRQPRFLLPDTDDSCYSCFRTGKHRWQLLLLLLDRRTQMTAATPVPDRKTQMAAAISAAGQENTDNSCYAVGQENTR
jgi:hypothetical protein